MFLFLILDFRYFLYLALKTERAGKLLGDTDFSKDRKKGVEESSEWKLHSLLAAQSSSSLDRIRNKTAAFHQTICTL